MRGGWFVSWLVVGAFVVGAGPVRGEEEHWPLDFSKTEAPIPIFQETETPAQKLQVSALFSAWGFDPKTGRLLAASNVRDGLIAFDDSIPPADRIRAIERSLDIVRWEITQKERIHRQLTDLAAKIDETEQAVRKLRDEADIERLESMNARLTELHESHRALQSAVVDLRAGQTRRNAHFAFLTIVLVALVLVAAALALFVLLAVCLRYGEKTPVKKYANDKTIIRFNS